MVTEPTSHLIPQHILNLIDGQEVPPIADAWFSKLSPVSGKALAMVSRSQREDIAAAVSAAKSAQISWGEVPGVRRGETLFAITEGLQKRRDEIASIVSIETGKSKASALAETDAAISLGRFMAGEGQRLYGRTTTSASVQRHVMTIRQPMGVAGLIIAANTPIANVAWKVFPALICGNAVVLKTAEDTPATAWCFGDIATQAGLPAGVLNIVHGFGAEAGAPLVESPDVSVISFTGSAATGREVNRVAAARLAKVSLELGGKNPFVVCDDADLDQAVHWAVLSAFSNAGQRCAAASRIIVFDAVYEAFLEKLIARTNDLKIGPGDNDDFGPVINERQLNRMLSAVQTCKAEGGNVLTGGDRLTGPSHATGFYMAATLVDQVDPNSAISRDELFGPIACLYRANSYHHALAIANDCPYGLTACIHTSNHHRAQHFIQHVQAGVAVVNAGTFGSEPHMPFGGSKQSGNGSREPGTEAIDVYSHLKDVYISYNHDAL